MRSTFLFLLVIAVSFMACQKDSTTTTTPTTEQQQVFKEFWDIYDRHYPLMHRKNINWQQVYDTYYPQITATTTDTELFNHFKTILMTVVKDGHTDVTYNNSMQAGYETMPNAEIEQMLSNNTASKVNIVASSSSNQYLSYGTLVSNSNIGYINSKRFEPLSDDYDTEFTAFKTIVDQALTALQGKTGIIIDVRTNGGGQGPFAYYLAGRFLATTSPITIVRQRIKERTGSGLDALSPWKTQNFMGYPDSRVEGGYTAGVFTDDFALSASGSFQFTNKVAVLTANGTASAAEYFTTAMKTQSHVKTIGDKTFGIFAGSDIFTLNKGNGKWKTRVSTHDVEMFYGGSFQSFEGTGITPDELSIPTAADVSAGKDTHIDAAVIYIN